MFHFRLWGISLGTRVDIIDGEIALNSLIALKIEQIEVEFPPIDAKNVKLGDFALH